MSCLYEASLIILHVFFNNCLNLKCLYSSFLTTIFSTWYNPEITSKFRHIRPSTLVWYDSLAENSRRITILLVIVFPTVRESSGDPHYPSISFPSRLCLLSFAHYPLSPFIYIPSTFFIYFSAQQRIRPSSACLPY